MNAAKCIFGSWPGSRRLAKSRSKENGNRSECDVAYAFAKAPDRVILQRFDRVNRNTQRVCNLRIGITLKCKAHNVGALRRKVLDYGFQLAKSLFRDRGLV